jgi:hypothetical protein
MWLEKVKWKKVGMEIEVMHWDKILKDFKCQGIWIQLYRMVVTALSSLLIAIYN